MEDDFHQRSMAGPTLGLCGSWLLPQPISHQGGCSVGSKNQHKSPLPLPSCEDVKTQYILYKLYLNHFTLDCFLNRGQYKTGFPSKLKLKDGSISAICDPGSNVETEVL